jgi:hypothetical protein
MEVSYERISTQVRACQGLTPHRVMQVLAVTLILSLLTVEKQRGGYLILGAHHMEIPLAA